MIKSHFIFDPVQKRETKLKFYRLSDATFYDHIYTIFIQLINLSWIKKCHVLRNMDFIL